MENKQKKYNSTLLVISGVASVLAIYFGIKSQNLSKELDKKSTITKIEVSNEVEEDISKIDSLLFEGEYVDALKVSNELKKELNNFQNDSVLLLKYNLVSEIVSVKNTTNTKSTNPQETLADFVPTDSGENSSNEITESNTSNNSNESDKQGLISELNPIKKINTSTSDYLTFNTTKGTNLHYIGAIKKHKANGYGVAILESGSRYEGQWKNNKRHGKGKFYWNDGQYYEGTYVKDKRDGIGIYTWKNGEKYIGEWKNDKRNGRGEFYNKKGKLKTTGVWENDELISEDKKDKNH